MDEKISFHLNSSDSGETSRIDYFPDIDTYVEVITTNGAMRVSSDIDQYLSDYVASRWKLISRVALLLRWFNFDFSLSSHDDSPHILSFPFSSTNRVTRIHEFLHTIVLKLRKSNISSLLNSRFVCGREMNFYEAIPKHRYSFFFHKTTKKNKSTELFRIRAVCNRINFLCGNSQSLGNSKYTVKWILH